MIFDNILNCDIYRGMNKDLDIAFDIAKTLSENSEIGKIIVNNNLYYMIMEVDTVEETDKEFETHNHYADFQFILKGDEKVNFISPQNLEVSTIYNKENDCQFYSYKNSNGLIVSKGEFYIVFPHEAHMPTCKNVYSSVKKAVFKVKIN